MNTKKIVRMAAQITALSLLLFTTTAYALSPGVTTMENRNHDYRVDEEGNYIGTDTIDYCLWASDVQVTVSALEELMASGEDALKAELEEASQYSFMVRTTTYQPVTEGYDVDISSIRAEVTPEGYPVRVTLPPITEGIVSAITYRVYVVEDPYTPPGGETEDPTPAVYTLTIRYLDGEGREVQNAYTAQYPGGAEYDVSNEVPLSIAGYTRSGIEGSLTGVISSDTEVIVTYEKDAEPLLPPGGEEYGYYYVTVRYVDKDTEEELLAPYQSDGIQEGQRYDVSEQANAAIDGYSIVEISGETDDQITRDVVVTVFYKADKDETVLPGTETAPDDTTGNPDPGEGAAAPITPAQPQSPDTPNTPTQAASPVQQAKPSLAADKDVNRTAVDHSGIPGRNIGTDANHGISEIREGRETSIAPVKPKVPAKENLKKTQVGITVEKTKVSMKGGSVLEFILTGLSGAAVAVLCGGIVSDIRVLRWYEERKKRVIRL